MSAAYNQRARVVVSVQNMQSGPIEGRGQGEIPEEIYYSRWVLLTLQSNKRTQPVRE